MNWEHFTLEQLRPAMTRIPFFAQWEIELIEFGEGRAKIAVPLSPALANIYGTLHGGVPLSLVDSVTGLAVWSVVEEGQWITTVEMQLHFLAPVRELNGRLMSSGWVVQRGSRLALAEGDVTDEAGRLIAKGSATYLIARKDAAT